MGGCSYEGCANRNEKGFQMCIFPKDKIRRNAWLQNCNNRVRNPDNKYIQLCHVHFEDSMWCWLGPNKRRLRPDAVPTLFENQRLSIEKNRIVTGFQNKDCESFLTQVDLQDNLKHYSIYSAENVQIKSELADGTAVNLDTHTENVISLESAEHDNHRLPEDCIYNKFHTFNTADDNRLSDALTQSQHVFTQGAYLNTSPPSENVEDKIKIEQEEIKRREEVMKRREEEMKRREEEMIRREEDVKRREVEIKRKEEVIKRKEAEMKNKYLVIDKIYSKELHSKIYFKKRYYACKKQLQRIEKNVVDLSDSSDRTEVNAEQNATVEEQSNTT